MKLTFQINYRTEYGQALCLYEIGKPVYGWTEKNPLIMRCQGQDFWTAEVEVEEVALTHYKYAIYLGDHILPESGEPRVLALRKADKDVIIRDFWQFVDYEKSFYSTAFLKSLFKRHGHI